MPEKGTRKISSHQECLAGKDEVGQRVGQQ